MLASDAAFHDFLSSDIFQIEIELATKGRKRLSGRNSQVSDGADGDQAKQPRVLLYGRWRELALYRAEVLERMGFDVIIPSSREEALKVVHRGGFEAAILSYTLSSDTVKEFADLIRQKCPGCPLLTISQTAESDPHIMPDEVVLSELGPAGLVAALHRAFRRREQ